MLGRFGRFLREILVFGYCMAVVAMAGILMLVISSWFQSIHNHFYEDPDLIEFFQGER